MADNNLYHAALGVHSEFEALRSSARPYDIPESLLQALVSLGSAVVAADSAPKVPENPLVDINAGGTMRNAQQALDALSFFVANSQDNCGMNNCGLHFLFLCIDTAMRHAIEQYDRERQVAQPAGRHV